MCPFRERNQLIVSSRLTYNSYGKKLMEVKPKIIRPQTHSLLTANTVALFAKVKVHLTSNKVCAVGKRQDMHLRYA